MSSVAKDRDMALSNGLLDASDVKRNIEEYVECYNQKLISADAVAESFLEVLVGTGYTSKATEFLRLLPHDAIESVKDSLSALRVTNYCKAITPRPGNQLSTDQLVALSEQRRAMYAHLDQLINMNAT